MTPPVIRSSQTKGRFAVIGTLLTLESARAMEKLALGGTSKLVCPWDSRRSVSSERTWSNEFGRATRDGPKSCHALCLPYLCDLVRAAR
jgi:hypothetical protein